MNLFKYFFSFLLVLAVGMSAPCLANSGESSEKAKDWIQHQSVKFLENRGQITDMTGSPVPFVLFKIETPGLDIYVTQKGLTYLFFEIEEEEHELINEKEHGETKEIKWERVDVSLKGASIKKENIVKESPSITNYNYFYPHCPEGIYGVKQYEKITIKDIYPGIDWVLYNSNTTGFKYDFVVHPNGDYEEIKLIYSSKKPLQIPGNGILEATTGYGNLTEHAPETFLDGQFIPSSFKHEQTIRNEQGGYDVTIGFAIDTTNSKLKTRYSKLIIDPQLTWGTFYGGSGADGFMSMDCDMEGNIYVTGYIIMGGFPTLPWNGAYYNGIYAGGQNDIFVLRFSKEGILEWATYYGGSNQEIGNKISVDVQGNIYITGFTNSSNFPTLPWGSAYHNNTLGGGNDAFILRFSNSGVLEWATYYGGIGGDYGFDISTDNDNNIYVTGATSSNDFNTQPWNSAYYNPTYALGDMFLLRFSNTGVLEWGTYYGGSNYDQGTAMIMDDSNNVYITGHTYSLDFPTQSWGNAYHDKIYNGGNWDAFVVRFSNFGQLDWSTYYGGNRDDRGHDLTIDNGIIYLAGTTTSTNFPTMRWGAAYYDSTHGGTWNEDIFLLRFSNSGQLNWSTYYGSDGQDIMSPGNIKTDDCGNVSISFETTSTNITTYNPGCGSYYDGTLGGMRDAFIVQFNKIGQLIWATYVGGDKFETRSIMAINPDNHLFLAGEWVDYDTVTSLPLMNPGNGTYSDVTPNGSDDSYIVRFTPDEFIYFSQSLENDSCDCNGAATVNITCGVPPFSYFWSNGTEIVNSTDSSNTVTGLCPGYYSLKITDATCNKREDTLYYVVNGVENLPDINLGPDTFICLGQSFYLETEEIDNAAYLWSDSSTGYTVEIKDTGMYWVKVILNQDCYKTDSIEIDLKDCENDLQSLYIPNAFSPNEDGENDILYTKGISFWQGILRIYNHFGTLLFETSSDQIGWDGKYKNRIVPEGVYVYHVQINSSENTLKEQQGNITLFR